MDKATFWLKIQVNASKLFKTDLLKGVRLGIFLLITTMSLTTVSGQLQAQELNCFVSANASQITGGDYTFLSKQFGEELTKYLSTLNFTEDKFETEERIDCNIQINFTEALSVSRFQAEVLVSSTRPIYGTTQSTGLLQLNGGKWVFDYVPNQPLNFDPERFNELTSVLDFFAYVVLGYDYDTFSPLGGTPYFEKARRIANLAQTSGSLGWEVAGVDNSRGILIEQILDARMQPVRNFYYDYHFSGLDHFLKQPDVARQAILQGLQTIQPVSQDAGNRRLALENFFTIKAEELVNIFKNTPYASRVYGLCLEMDPARGSRYDPLVN